MKNWMKYVCIAIALGVLGGCGSFIRSNVTAFHEWPEKLPRTSYVFERSALQDANLEYRSYENLVRAQLNQLGLVEAGPKDAPYLKVKFNTDVQSRDVHEVYPVVTHPFGSPWMGHPFYGPGWGMPMYGPAFMGPIYYGPPVVQQQEMRYTLHKRELKLTISRFEDGRSLFQSHVVSEGQNASLPQVMPYLVRSMFHAFPGPSGVTRQVELKIESD